jgi:hypothetical protein
MTIFMDFYILDKKFYLSYIDCTDIIPIGIDICLIDICVFIVKHKQTTLDITHK